MFGLEWLFITHWFWKYNVWGTFASIEGDNKPISVTTKLLPISSNSLLYSDSKINSFIYIIYFWLKQGR